MTNQETNKINISDALALLLHCTCINFAYAKHMFIVYSLYVLILTLKVY